MAVIGGDRQAVGNASALSRGCPHGPQGSCRSVGLVHNSTGLSSSRSVAGAALVLRGGGVNHQGAIGLVLGELARSVKHRQAPVGVAMHPHSRLDEVDTLRAGRDGNRDGSDAENEHRCTGWEASRDGTRGCSSCGSSACGQRLEGKSRMRRESQVRFCEGREVRLPSATRLVIALEDRHSGKRLLDVLGKRLGRYGLTLHETKTRYVDFRRRRPYGRHWMASATTFADSCVLDGDSWNT